MPRNDVVAARLLEKGCRLGNARGCARLGAIYVNGGNGVAANPKRARELFQQACAGQSGLGCAFLAVGHWSKGGDVVEARTALDLAEKGCRLGNGWSCGLEGSWAAAVAGPGGDEARVRRAFARGCDLDDAPACSSAGMLALTGSPGAPADDQRALAFLKKGCDGGDGGGCHELGVFYNDGRAGLARDEGRALALFQRACKLGDTSACPDPGAGAARGRPLR
jgi:TPR repeat protein